MSAYTSIGNLLMHGADDRIAALDPVLTRHDIVEDALRFAATLQTRQIQRLAVHLQDAADLATVLLGAWRAGAMVVMPADLQQDSRRRLEHQVDLIISDEEPDTHLHLCLDNAALPPTPLSPDDICLTLSTSGSSGQPKLIEKRLYQLDNEVAALEALWGSKLGGAAIIASVSAQHIYGLLFRVLWPLCAGRPFVRLAQPYPEYLQQASLACANSGFAWVTSPALLKRLGDNLDWAALSAVRQVFSSGGALPLQASSDVHSRLGLAPIEIYGSSETGGIAWRQETSLWTPFSGVALSPNEDGSFQIESPYLPQGQAEPCADAITVHSDGRFELLGRLDRIVKLEEKRISLARLEQVLAQHPWVADTRLGVVQGNRASIGAVVALSAGGIHALRNQGRRCVTQALRAQLIGHCETLALPRRWRLVSQLPFNSQGKWPQREIDQVLATERTRQPERIALARQEDGWIATLDVPLDLAHFSGHFSTTPILPGVIQVDWAIGIARELMALPPRFAGMEVLKFQQLVRPGDRIELTLRFDAERNKLHFAYRNGEAACASGRVLLGDADA
jgi:acyl-coenzyme A synthetase/AMP-(fatty) acid ligase/3-hydroxymyristoyl/3-hydroxydecanoyl-(acyl carrier protein) dehydratase